MQSKHQSFRRWNWNSENSEDVLLLFKWKSHIRTTGKLLHVKRLYNYVSSFWKQIWQRKESWKKLLLTGTLALLPVDSSAATSIAYKLVMLLIKRRNVLVKVSFPFNFLSKRSRWEERKNRKNPIIMLVHTRARF